MFTPKNYTLITVSDHRSEHTFMTVGWPAAARENYLEAMVIAAVEQTNLVVGSQPLLIIRDSNQQVGLASFVMNPTNVQTWIQHFTQIFDENPDISSGQATVVIVAPEAVAKSFPAFCVPPTTEAEEVTANLQRYQKGSTEHIIIAGPEPAAKVGSLETFVAMCLLMNPMNPFVASCLPARISLQPMRALVEGKPRIIWSCSGENSESGEILEVLENTAKAVISIPENYSRTEFEQVKQFSFSNLSRPRLAPDNLARFLTQYSVMGWGIDALLDTHRINSLSLENLAPAFAELVYPIGAVLGLDLVKK
ncbi:MAG: hypothetical protein SPI83_08365 [Rothia sp. (in: high G+C Gram-positive bacteria)]|nr:hypothetical protein [Rothia sp. (in: high G+C Gram-positive bacteria)]